MRLKLQLGVNFNVCVWPNWLDTDAKLDMEAKPPHKTCTHMVESCILMAPFLTNSPTVSLVEAGTLITSSALMVM